MVEREGRLRRGSKPVNSGEHREQNMDPLFLAHDIRTRGSLGLEMSIYRGNERRYGHGGGNRASLL